MTPYYDEDGITIYHGDCREIDAWDIAGGVMVTDPPYGMAYDSGRVAGRSRPIANDDNTEVRDEIIRRWGARPWAVFGTWKVPRPDGTKQVLVWDKTDGTGPGVGDLRAAFGSSHEEIYLSDGWFNHAGRRGSVLRTAVAMGNPYGLVASIGHPTPKPVGLMAVLVESAAPLATIVDPFMGSGSTLRAAKDLGRSAIGIELEERYCEIAVKRLAQGVLDFGASA